MSFSDLKVKRIETTADTLTVEIMDGRVLSVPLAYYPTLLHVTEAQRKNCQPIGAGCGIEWPDLDYHLSVEGLIQGHPEAPGLQRAKATVKTWQANPLAPVCTICSKSLAKKRRWRELNLHSRAVIENEFVTKKTCSSIRSLFC
jgi:Protein of unknown function (DUF2442)